MKFGDLPEGCIAKVISLTTPIDACRLSVVSPAFRSAADSDTVWNEFLPSNYVSMVSRRLSSKKRLFLSLCHNHILTKSFWLEKKSGKQCYMIAARDLIIVWGGKPEYWCSTIVPNSGWLEICGKIETSRLSSATTYIACLIFKIKPEATNLGMYASEVSVGVIGGTMNKSAVCLNPDFGAASVANRLPPLLNNRALGMECPTRRNDGWLEIKLGEYFNGNAEVEGEILEISFMEVEDAYNTGLNIQGIEIRPKSV